MKTKFLFLTCLFLSFTTLINAQISNGLVAYYPFNGNANDAVGSVDGTVSNATLTADRFGNANSAYSFTNSGVRSFIDLGNSFNAITSGAGKQFSVSVWFRRSDMNGGMQFFMKHGNSWCNNIEHQFAMGINPAGLLSFNYYDGSGGTATSLVANYVNPKAAVNDTEWHHYVVVYDGTKPTGQQRATLYLDNALLETTLTNNGANVGDIPALNSHLGIGHSLSTTGTACGNSNYGTRGDIDDIRLYDRLLTPCDIRDLAIEGDATEGLEAHYPFDGNANDAVGNVDGVVNNATLTTDRFGNPNSAYDFTTNGVRSFIDLGNSFNSITSGEGSTFSVSLWFKRSDLNKGMQFLMKHGNAWCNNIEHQFAVGMRSTGEIYFNYYDASAGTASGIKANYQETDSTVTDTAWHHLVVTYNGVMNIGEQRATLYLDNQLWSSNLTNNGSDVQAIPVLNSHLGIGHSLSTTGTACGSNTYGSDGAMDDFHVYNRVLSICDVDDLYTPAVTTSTQKLKDIETLSLYPNPVSNQLTVALNANVSDNFTLRVINSTGQLVTTQQMSMNRSVINTSELAKGIYFVQIVGNNGILSTQKFVKA